MIIQDKMKEAMTDASAVVAAALMVASAASISTAEVAPTTRPAAAGAFAATPGRTRIRIGRRRAAAIRPTPVPTSGI